MSRPLRSNTKIDQFHLQDSATKKRLRKKSNEQEDSDSVKRHCAMDLASMTTDEKINFLVEKMISVEAKQDTASTNINTIINEIGLLKNDYKCVSEKVDNVESNMATLKSENEYLKKSVNSLAQQSLSNEICIFNLPPVNKDKVDDVILGICSATGFPMNIKNDIKTKYVVTQKNNKAHIVINFYDQRCKDGFMNSCKNKKPLLFEDICKLKNDDLLNGTEIFVKNKLSQFNREILKEARNHKEIFKFVWESEGRILMRHDETSPIIHVQSVNDVLEAVKKPKNKTSQKKGKNKNQPSTSTPTPTQAVDQQ